MPKHYIGIAAICFYWDRARHSSPLYPLLIRIVGALIGNSLIAALAISNVASFFALLYLYKLIEHEYNRQVAHRAIFYVLRIFSRRRSSSRPPTLNRCSCA